MSVPAQRTHSQLSTMIVSIRQCSLAYISVLYIVICKKKKGKGSFYIAQYPVRRTAQSAVHFLPSLVDLFIPTPTRLLREAFYSHATTVYSKVLICTAESTRASIQRTKVPNLRNGSKGGFEPGLT